MPLFVAALVLLAQAATAALPPPYPRAGTTKLLENDKVIVWDVAWLEQQYPLHTHTYELVGMSYVAGDRIILQADGSRRRTSTPAWSFQTQRAAVTHYEEGVGDPPMRSVQIELKIPAPGATTGVAGESLRQVFGPPAAENHRAVVFLLQPSSSTTSHRHVGDAVEVVYDGPKPTVTFVPAGTAHNGPTLSASGRAYIFELK
jgi:hypothetical protein